MARKLENRKRPLGKPDPLKQASGKHCEESPESPYSDLKKEGMVEGRNAVLSLLAGPRDVDRLFIAKETGGGVSKIIAAAKARGIPVRFADRRKLDVMSDTGAHQGVIAFAAAKAFSSIQDVLAAAREKGEPPLVVVLDGVTDPHNIGAIIRSAEAAGAHGVVIPKHRSAGLTAVAAKAAAGALESMPVVRVSNLPSLLRELKQAGVWIFGTCGQGGTVLYDADFTLPAAIVIGSEGEGIGRLVSEHCDFMLRIPMRGQTASLNASAAAAIVLFEAVRKRGGAK